TMERLEATLDTLERLEKFHGHLFNWYDLGDLHPLEPRYVSTVDSGNLVGHLVAVAQACRELGGRAIVGPEVLQGIGDTLRLAREAAERLPQYRGLDSSARRDLLPALAAIDSLRAPIPSTLRDWLVKLRQVRAHTASLRDRVRTMAETEGGVAAGELVAWVEASNRAASEWTR